MTTREGGVRGLVLQYESENYGGRCGRVDLNEVRCYRNDEQEPCTNHARSLSFAQ